MLNYFLWRDRKGGVSNFVSFLATLILLQLTALWIYQALVPDSYRFLSIFEGDRWLTTLLAANLVLMTNRVVAACVLRVELLRAARRPAVDPAPVLGQLHQLHGELARDPPDHPPRRSAPRRLGQDHP